MMSWPALKTLSPKPHRTATASTAKKVPEPGRTHCAVRAEARIGNQSRAQRTATTCVGSLLKHSEMWLPESFTSEFLVLHCLLERI